MSPPSLVPTSKKSRAAKRSGSSGLEKYNLVGSISPPSTNKQFLNDAVNLVLFAGKRIESDLFGACAPKDLSER